MEVALAGSQAWSCTESLPKCCTLIYVSRPRVVFHAGQLQAGSKAVAKRASLLDGELFFMKQLLILREQIAPFDAEFSITEKDLDFTHMRDYLRRILAGVALPALACLSSCKRQLAFCTLAHMHACICCPAA